jgi:hypothetical protein
MHLKKAYKAAPLRPGKAMPPGVSARFLGTSCLDFGKLSRAVTIIRSFRDRSYPGPESSTCEKPAVTPTSFWFPALYEALTALTAFRLVLVRS